MPPEPPSWLDEATLRRLRTPPPRGRDMPASDADTRDRLWARYPALPLTAIEEAVRYLHPGPAGGRASSMRLLARRLARITARFRPPS